MGETEAGKEIISIIMQVISHTSGRAELILTNSA